MQLNNDILNKISDQLAIDIDNYCDKKWAERFGTRIGLSSIGDDCQRKIWYGFRRCKMPKHSPRIKRLFSRGHLEEPRFIDYLQGIGCKIYPFDTNYKLYYNNITSEFKVATSPDDGFVDVSEHVGFVHDANRQGVEFPVQWRVSAVHGHVAGALDGKGYLPESYGIDGQILFEFKTHGDKSFKDLQKQGMKMSKPLHYAQCCAYGYLSNLNYACYVAVNKNTDDLYIEVVALNQKTGEALIQKAERIVTIQEPPPRLHENPTFWICKGCDYFSICHAKEQVHKNCRSCKHAEAVKDKQWVCNKHSQILTEDIILNEYGCWENICG